MKKIADTMTSAGRKISYHTVENYLEGITDSLLMYRVGRYDVKGKEYLQLLDKYYLVDVGLRVLSARNTQRGLWAYVGKRSVSRIVETGIPRICR